MKNKMVVLTEELESAYVELSNLDKAHTESRKKVMQRLNLIQTKLSALVSMMPDEASR